MLRRVTTRAPMAWAEARRTAYAAGLAARPEPVVVPLAEADGYTLVGPLTALTDLPAFRTSSVDGYAVRGAGPWPVVGQVFAGSMPRPLHDGTAVRIATGAMVPEHTLTIIRLEDAEPDPDGLVRGDAAVTPEWREPGDEALRGDELLP